MPDQTGGSSEASVRSSVRRSLPFLPLRVLQGAVIAGVVLHFHGGAGTAGGPYDGMRLLLILWAVLALVAVSSVRRPPALMPLSIAILAVGTVSSLLGQFPLVSLREVVLLVALMWTATTIAATGRGLLVVVGTVLAVVQAAWTIDYVAYWADGVFWGNAYHPMTAFLGFRNPRFLNDLQAWMLPVGLAFCLRARAPTVVRIFFWALLLVSAAQLWLAMARGALLALVAGALFVAVFGGARGRAFGLSMGATVAAGWGLHQFLFGLFYPASAGTLAGRGATDSGRIALWQRAWEMFLDSPLVGHGPQSFAWQGATNSAPHSLPLQLLAEWGLLGVAIFAIATVLAVMGIRRATRRKRQRPATRFWTVALTAATVSGGANCLVSNGLITPWGLLGAVVILAMWLRLIGVERTKPPRAPALALAALLILVLAPYFVSPERSFPLLGPSVIPTPEVGWSPGYSPRFWMNEP